MYEYEKNRSSESLTKYKGFPRPWRVQDRRFLHRSACCQQTQ